MSLNKENPTENLDELEELKWLSTKTPEEEEMSFTDRALAKFWKNPVIPLGALATTAVLCNGVYNLYKGDRHKQQRMMRYRVLAQGITIAATTFTIFYTAQRK